MSFAKDWLEMECRRISVVKVFVYKMNRIGPRTEPCGTPKFWLWKFVVDGNSLSSIGKVGSEPVERCTRNSREVLKSLTENVVIYGVERSRQIKKSYDSYIAIVQSMQNVTHHIEQGNFSTVPWPIC